MGVRRRLKFLGSTDVQVDGRPVEPARTMTYKGMMPSDVHNLALAIGYTNASLLSCAPIRDRAMEFSARARRA